MDALFNIARRIKAALSGLLGHTKAVPAPPRAKLHGRRGYGDNDIAPPGG
jgi:hypothetical protein